MNGNCDCCGRTDVDLTCWSPGDVGTLSCLSCQDELNAELMDACTCTMSSVNSASIDPPHEVVNKNCPIHGNAAARDPDAAYEARRDDPPEPFWMEDDS